MSQFQNKLTEFIAKKASEAATQKLGTAATKNIAPVGQPALEPEIIVGADVRVLEIMRTSVYDPDRTGVVNDALALDGNTPADLLDRANHTGTQTASTISDFGTAVQSYLTWFAVFKLADQSKTSDTTLANDSELTLTLVAANTYRVKFYVLLTAANATMDYKFAINFSGTTTSVYAKAKYVAAGGTAETIVAQNSIIGSTSVTAVTSGVAYVEVDCVIEVNAGGTLGFQWSQDTSDAGALTVLKGSYVEYANCTLPL
jgi:hypothetical protein